jgi:predicted transcriptional regulator
LQNEEVLKELRNNEAEYKIIEEIITVRQEKNLTQKELAELVGTKQSNISRLESGNYNPEPSTGGAA